MSSSSQNSCVLSPNTAASPSTLTATTARTPTTRSSLGSKRWRWPSARASRGGPPVAPRQRESLISYQLSAASAQQGRCGPLRRLDHVSGVGPYISYECSLAFRGQLQQAQT